MASAISPKNASYSGSDSSEFSGDIQAQTPEKFSSLLQRQQAKTVSKVASMLESCLSEDAKKRVSIYTTGSDARGEAFSQGLRLSPVELLVVDENSSSSDEDRQSENGPEAVSSVKLAAPSAEKIKTKRSIIDFVTLHPNVFDPVVQFIGRSANPLIFKEKADQKDDGVVIPSRAVDAIPILGAPRLVEAFQDRLIERLKNISEDEIHLFDTKFYGQASIDIKKNMKKKSVSSVNLDTGVLTFDGRRNKSVKYTFCRAVQYKIVRIYLMAIKNKLIHASAIVKQMPKNTIDRIYWLRANGLLKMDAGKVEKLVAAYKQCTQWYIASQQAYKKGQTSIQVDPQILNEVAKEIFEFFQLK